MKNSSKKVLSFALATVVVAGGVVAANKGEVNASAYGNPSVSQISRLRAEDPLSGTINLNGNAVFGAMVYVEVASANTTALECNWTRDGQKIDGATELFYLIDKDDIGCIIGCEITATDRDGSLVTAFANPVEKKDGPAAPSVSSVSPSAKNGDGIIYGLDETMEWCTYQSFDRDVKPCTTSCITGLFAGDYYVRYKETETAKAGIAKHLWIPKGYGTDLTGEVALTGDAKFDSTLTAEVTNSNGQNLNYIWTRDGKLVEGETGDSYKLTVDDIGCVIGCEVFSTEKNGTIKAQTSSAVEKKDGPGRPDVDIVYPTAEDRAGKIIGVDPTMEYSTYQSMTTSV